jgi:TonB-linked SusC/RagA family outer membrane protein
MKVKGSYKHCIATIIMALVVFLQTASASYNINQSCFKKLQIVGNNEQHNETTNRQRLWTDSLKTNAYKDSKDIPVLYQSKTLDEITGAVYCLTGEKVQNIPGVNRFNSLTGRVPGLMVLQNDGFSGKESTFVFIRGRRTFGASGNTSLVLLDGVETDITQISPFDIESVTVLKDAVSTAMYGLRGSNGVVLITSKRGKEGNIRINLNSQATLISPSKFSEFLGADDYARLYNEAAMNEGLPAKYTSEEIEAFENGSDPFLYPNNNWISDYMADYSIQTRQNLDISGGNEFAKYIFSVGYLNNSGIFNTDEDSNPYNTNSSLDLTDFHTNLDIKASNWLIVNVDLKAKFDRRNNPGSFTSTYEENLIGNMMNTPPLAYPVLNPDGSLGGNTDYRENIYGLLNNAGYSIWNQKYLYGNVDFTHKLDFLLSGLSLKGQLGFSNFVNHITNRSKDFAVYEYIDDETYNKIGNDTEMESTSQYSTNNRYINGELGFKFEKSFGNHTTKNLLFLDRQKYINRIAKLPRIYQGIKGSFSYEMDAKYFLDFVFAYQGSEQFPKRSRYGFFPAAGLGWIVSREHFFNKINFVNYLKIRASLGRTGNDFNPYYDSTPYFAYLENYELFGGYFFGTSPRNDGGFRESSAANNSITWEKSERFNIGADAALLSNKISLTIDYFYEKNKDILVYGANPGIYGTNFWYPVGIVKNQGIEGMVSWSQKTGGFEYFLNANATFTKNIIIEQKEQPKLYEWMERTGNPIDSRFGYVFDRYFTENDDFSQLPDQSQLGTVRPGDLKYKDLNGDNIIDLNDQKLIGSSYVPKLFYGLNAGFNFKGIDFNVLFQGMRGTDQIFSGSMVYEFINGKGNVTKKHLGRWTTGSGQNATYPRLAIEESSNNRQPSDYWVMDGSYLRLKTIELGYPCTPSVLKKIYLKKLRLYLSGYNLLTWSKIDFTDPETTASGTNYPVSSMISAGLNLGF